MTTPFQWSSIALGSLAILGLMLLTAALFPRRRGKTPYCRRCRYNLTGIESERCPECGTPLSRRGAVLRGERRRRPRLAIVGLAVLLGAAGPLGVRSYRWVKSVRWYSYRPIAWVTDDFLRTAGGIPMLKARSEISDRLKQERLSNAQLARLIERLLDALAPHATPLAPVPEIVALVGEVYETGRLDEAQRKRLFETCFQVSAAARTELPAGHLWRTMLALRMRIPRSLRVHVKAHYTLDGVRSRFLRWDQSYSSIVHPRLLGVPIPDLAEGRHELSYVVEYDFYDKGDNAGSESLYHVSRTLNLSTEVLAEAPDDYIRLVRAPELKENIHACLDITRLVCQPYETGGMLLQITIAASAAPPIGLAFDVAAEFDGRVLALGRYALSQSDFAMREIVGVPLSKLFSADAPKTVTLIFTPSRKAAIESIDLYEIWDGELRFEDLPVKSGP